MVTAQKVMKVPEFEVYAGEDHQNTPQIQGCSIFGYAVEIYYSNHIAIGWIEEDAHEQWKDCRA